MTLISSRRPHLKLSELMAASVNTLGEGSGNSYPLCCGQRSLLSGVIVAKCTWPSVPYFAGSLGMQCLLLPEVRCALCVLCAPCAPASPGEASDAGPKAADPGEMGPEAALGPAASPCCRHCPG